VPRFAHREPAACKIAQLAAAGLKDSLPIEATVCLQYGQHGCAKGILKHAIIQAYLQVDYDFASNSRGNDISLCSSTHPHRK
jgi:hypothetical protein